MPVADMLIDVVAGHEILSFMDGTTGYHQIPVVEADRHKTVFRCPAFIRAFEYVVMPFGLKNAGATYQRAMNLIFHDILDKILEVYIDDVVVKSKVKQDHIADLREGAKEFVWEPCHQEAFDRINEYMANPPILMPPKPGIPLKLYISASESSIAGLLVQDNTNQEGRTIEHAIYYLSKTLLDAETRMSIYLVTLCWSSISYEENSSVSASRCSQTWKKLLDSLADGVRKLILKVEKQTLPSFMARKEDSGEWLVATVDVWDVDWRQPIMDYLINSSTVIDKQIRFIALNYMLKGGELLKRGENGVDFLCVYGREAKQIMREVHLGVCGSHQAGPKMRCLICRHGFYWTTILKDCISFTKGCLECQVHGPVQHIPNIPMQPIIKPWKHKFILVGTDLFTKWVEAKPVKEASAKTIYQFIFKNIICRYGIQECLVADRG
ncbi:hypothetical protein ACLB2K_073978 [Fragaria x ananassa]